MRTFPQQLALPTRLFGRGRALDVNRYGTVPRMHARRVMAFDNEAAVAPVAVVVAGGGVGVALAWRWRGVGVALAWRSRGGRRSGRTAVACHKLVCAGRRRT